MTYREALEAYRERFGDSFPLMMTMDWSDEEVIEEILRRLESGEPFEGDEGVAY